MAHQAQHGGLQGAAAAYKINVVPMGAWKNPKEALFANPGKVFTDSHRYPYLDHIKTVIQLQKEAFLTEMCVDEKSGKPPYKMGMDEEDYFKNVVLPVGIMVVFLAIVLCIIISRICEGKPILPFGSCDGYSTVGGGSVTFAPGRKGQTDEDIFTERGQQGTGSEGGTPGKGADDDGADAASAKKEKKELPYERIPTPGVAPYLWSPPPTIFQPSPTPAGTPFTGSPGGS